ncbi:hypothetical protein [Actinomadura sp. CNU-125]|nr:hypothetical protein [Actinomadura sp. CNU-125]
MSLALAATALEVATMVPYLAAVALIAGATCPGRSPVRPWRVTAS